MLQHQQQEHPSPGASPGTRRRSDGSVRECLFFPVLERNEQERLEAMVRRRTGATGGGAQENMRRTAGGGGVGAGGDPQDPLENRPKRWTWGGPPDGMEGHPKKPPCHAAIGSAQAANELPPASSPSSKSRNVSDFLTHPSSDQPVNKRLSNSSATLHSPERASTSAPKPHRSSSNRRSIAAFPEENAGAAWTPTTDSPTTPVRSASFRSQSKGPGTPKRVRSSRNRPQSPCSPGQYPPSPLRQRAGTPGTPDDRGLERKISKTETSENKKIPKSTSRDLGAESPGTPTGGRSFGGTTDAEEAGRLLAERRRLARVQKEQEERQRQEEERLRAEEEQRRQQEERERQERAALLAEEEKGRREEERKSREEEERRLKERRWKDMQDQLDREREEAFLRAQREAERKRQERELLHIQEEQERLQRKKRIEEIMKRTRKSVDQVDMPPAPVPELRSEADVVLEEEALLVPEAPVISLGPLETKSCVDELSDGVQSMDVSPVSRDEQASAQDFSPVTEGGITEGGDDTSNDARTLEHLLDLAAAQGRGGGGQGPGQQGEETTPPSYPKLGDLNKNLLIQACNAAASESSSSSQLIHSISPGKLDVQ